MVSDFVELLIAMRNGQVASDLNDKWNEVLEAVLRTAGKGELTIKFTVKPSKLGMGGAVIEVETDHDVKVKRPELKIGTCVFFVDREGRLSRDDPAQQAMFEIEEQQQQEKNSGRTK